jgi:hypothetical protein
MAFQDFNRLPPECKPGVLPMMLPDGWTGVVNRSKTFKIYRHIETIHIF